MTRFAKYINESKSIHQQIAETYGEEIYNKYKASDHHMHGSDKNNLAVIVFEYLQNLGSIDRKTAEKMEDKDLKKIAELILQKHG